MLTYYFSISPQAWRDLVKFEITASSSNLEVPTLQVLRLHAYPWLLHGAKHLLSTYGDTGFFSGHLNMKVITFENIRLF